MNYRSILIACLATLGLAVAGWGQADGKIAFLSYREGHEVKKPPSKTDWSTNRLMLR